MPLFNGDRVETLIINGDTGDNVWVTTYLTCENCERLEWYHPGECCLYTPNKFKPKTYGACGIGVSKDKGIFYVSHWPPVYAVWKYPEPTVLPQDVDWPHSEAIYWCHYLMEIGWKP